MNKFEILNKIALVQRDNGTNFTVNDKLNAIREILRSTGYNEVYAGNLTSVWSKLSEEEIKALPMPCLLTSHIDNVKSIKHPFVSIEESEGGRIMRGTFDNMATNAALVDIMVNKNVPDNVFFCFDGDEETGNCKGLKEAVEWIKEHCDNEIGFAIATDVTSEGFDEKNHISIENMSGSGTFQNNFCLDFLKMKKNFCLAPHPSETWRLPDCMEDYYEKGHEGWCDEGYVIRDLHLNGMSLCLPTKGPMHSDSGCIAWPEVFSHYVNDLCDTTKMLALMDKERILGTDERYEKSRSTYYGNSSYGYGGGYGGYYGNYSGYDNYDNDEEEEAYVSAYYNNDLTEEDLEAYKKEIEKCKDDGSFEGTYRNTSIELECADVTYAFLQNRSGLDEEAIQAAINDLSDVYYSQESYEEFEDAEQIKEFFISYMENFISCSLEYREDKENAMAVDEKEEDDYYQMSLFDKEIGIDNEEEDDYKPDYRVIEAPEYDDYGL